MTAEAGDRRLKNTMHLTFWKEQTALQILTTPQLLLWVSSFGGLKRKAMEIRSNILLWKSHKIFSLRKQIWYLKNMSISPWTFNIMHFQNKSHEKFQNERLSLLPVSSAPPVMQPGFRIRGFLWGREGCLCYIAKMYMVCLGVFSQPHAFTADHLVGNISICLQGTDFFH